MIAVDTNVLVYAHREELPQHTAALAWLHHLAASPAPWALPAPTLAEFVRVVTHPRVLDPPTPLEEALAAVEALLAVPTLRVLGAGRRYGALFADAVRTARATGNLAFDAQIAALCREHGVGRLLTRDRDFARFAWLSIVDIDEDPARSA